MVLLLRSMDLRALAGSADIPTPRCFRGRPIVTVGLLGIILWYLSNWLLSSCIWSSLRRSNFSNSAIFTSFWRRVFCSSWRLPMFCLFVVGNSGCRTSSLRIFNSHQHVGQPDDALKKARTETSHNRFYILYLKPLHSNMEITFFSTEGKGIVWMKMSDFCFRHQR